MIIDIKFPEPSAVIDENVLKLVRPLDRELQSEVRLTVQCNVTRLGDDVTDERRVPEMGNLKSEMVRSFRKQVVIHVEDLNDQVTIVYNTQFKKKWFNQEKSKQVMTKIKLVQCIFIIHLDAYDTIYCFLGVYQYFVLPNPPDHNFPLWKSITNGVEGKKSSNKVINFANASKVKSHFYTWHCWMCCNSAKWDGGLCVCGWLTFAPRL
jgi:hypothetical protein